MSYKNWGRSAAAMGALCLLVATYNDCGKYNFNSSSSAASTGTNTPAGFPNPPDTPISFTQTNCTLGYPSSTSNPATSVAFNESDVLAAFSPEGNVSSDSFTISVWYSDEHAMTLGVRRVVVKTSSGTTNTDYPVTAMNGDPDIAADPQVGTTALTGDQAGVDKSTCPSSPAGTTADACSRPLWPALFITDTTADPNSTSGDWQNGGTPIAPHAIYGTWKAAVRTIDKTQTPATVTVTTDSDPSPNYWDLGGGYPVPAGYPSEGFGTGVAWDVGRLGLQPGHSYRLQFMVHDGDQNKSGGDVGENCVNIKLP